MFKVVYNITDNVMKLKGGVRLHIPGHPDLSTEDLIRAVDNCQTIEQIFSFVKHTGLVIGMKSQQSASSLPKPAPVPMPQLAPLDSLKRQVKAAIYEADHREKREDILKQIDSCNTIIQIFQLVQRHNIVIQMKSQQSASCLPKQNVPLIPDKSPLDSLKEQVMEAVMNGGY